MGSGHLHITIRLGRSSCHFLQCWVPVKERQRRYHDEDSNIFTIAVTYVGLHLHTYTYTYVSMHTNYVYTQIYTHLDRSIDSWIDRLEGNPSIRPSVHPSIHASMHPCSMHNLETFLYNGGISVYVYIIEDRGRRQAHAYPTNWIRQEKHIRRRMTCCLT